MSVMLFMRLLLGSVLQVFCPSCKPREIEEDPEEKLHSLVLKLVALIHDCIVGWIAKCFITCLTSCCCCSICKTEMHTTQFLFGFLKIFMVLGTSGSIYMAMRNGIMNQLHACWIPELVLRSYHIVAFVVVSSGGLWSFICIWRMLAQCWKCVWRCVLQREMSKDTECVTCGNGCEFLVKLIFMLCASYQTGIVFYSKYLGYDFDPAGIHWLLIAMSVATYDEYVKDRYRELGVDKYVRRATQQRALSLQGLPSNKVDDNRDGRKSRRDRVALRKQQRAWVESTSLHGLTTNKVKSRRDSRPTDLRVKLLSNTQPGNKTAINNNNRATASGAQSGEWDTVTVLKNGTSVRRPEPANSADDSSTQQDYWHFNSSERRRASNRPTSFLGY